MALQPSTARGPSRAFTSPLRGSKEIKGFGAASELTAFFLFLLLPDSLLYPLASRHRGENLDRPADHGGQHRLCEKVFGLSLIRGLFLRGLPASARVSPDTRRPKTANGVNCSLLIAHMCVCMDNFLTGGFNIWMFKSTCTPSVQASAPSRTLLAGSGG